MHIEEAGVRGLPSILFLHGAASSGAMWAAHVAALGGRFHSLVPDLPGFGESAAVEWSSLPAVAEELAAIIRERASGRRAHVVGLSLGGAVAIQMIARAPEVVDHAIVDGAGVVPVPGAGAMKFGLRLLQPFARSALFARIAAGMLGVTAEGYDAFRRDIGRMSGRAFVKAFSEALTMGEPAGLAQSPVRTLFVAGEREPRESNRMLARTMRAAVACYAPASGHGWLARYPDLHIRMVEAWITDRPLPPELLRVAGTAFGGMKMVPDERAVIG
jgi:pimeloyl-ACP methyl ester carboxylesterase